jgi:hypothetical protein
VINAKNIKEQLKKTRIANIKETGKRYMSKSQIRESIKHMMLLQVPKEEKSYKQHGIVSIADMLRGM